MKKQIRMSERLYRKIIVLLGSNAFFYVTLVLIALQALWYALSLHPSINDEARHFENIVIYSHHLSPFLGSQNPTWDHLGAVTRDGSYMFYYIMSWPLRLVQLFTDGYVSQLIALRLVCLGFVIWGVIIYRRALLGIGLLSKSVVNVMWLFFALVPAFALLAGAVNYDNLVFLLFAYVLLLVVRLLKNRAVSPTELSYLIILALFMSVVKYTSIALTAPAIIFVLVDHYKRFGKQGVVPLKRSFLGLSRLKLALIITGLVVGTLLFMERPVLNLIKYSAPNPSCSQVIGDKRCQAFHDYVVYEKLHEEKSKDFRPYDPIHYVLVYWEPRMVSTMANQLERGEESSLPVITNMYFALSIGGLLTATLCLRELVRNKMVQLLICILFGFLAVLILEEYSVYREYGVPAAIRARYLVPILPIAGYLVGLSLVTMFGKYKKTLLIVTFAATLLMTQGGGIVTYALTTPNEIYWQNEVVKSVNDNMRKLLSPIVKE